ncbi:MAG TPA: hypothetical protein VLA12_00015 [Planctomycetaceae bacterium]|nr:hypothetical protein [Planctomycetaceae bacterium]
MVISVRCNSCGKQLKVKDHYAGRTGKCPDCGDDVPVPMLDDLDPSLWEDVEEPDRSDRIRCPMCGEMIVSSAAKCRFCGEVLNRRPSASDESIEQLVEEKIKLKQDSEIAMQIFVTGLIGCFAPIIAIYGIIFLIRRPYDYPRKSLAVAGTIFHCIWALIQIALIATGNMR